MSGDKFKREKTAPGDKFKRKDNSWGQREREDSAWGQIQEKEDSAWGQVQEKEKTAPGAGWGQVQVKGKTAPGGASSSELQLILKLAYYYQTSTARFITLQSILFLVFCTASTHKVAAFLFCFFLVGNCCANGKIVFFH